jgi:hypothetical protein
MSSVFICCEAGYRFGAATCMAADAFAMNPQA